MTVFLISECEAYKLEPDKTSEQVVNMLSLLTNFLLSI